MGQPPMISRSLYFITPIYYSVNSSTKSMEHGADSHGFIFPLFYCSVFIIQWVSLQKVWSMGFRVWGMLLCSGLLYAQRLFIHSF